MKADSSIFDIAEPLVSVIIPAYNSMPYLTECIKSVVNQSYSNLQIIVIDDGSTDDTARFMQSLSDSRIDFTSTENRGVSAARNLGLSKVAGEFVMFVDADDWIEPTYIEEAVSLMTEHKLDIVVGGTERILNEESSLLRLSPSQGFVLLDGPSTSKYFAQVLTNNANRDTGLDSCLAAANWCHLFTKKVIGDTRFKEEVRYGEDSLFNVEVALNANRIGVTASVWYHYIMHGDSAVYKLTKRNDSDIRIMTDKLLNIEGLTPECKRYAFFKCVNALHVVLFRSVNSGLTMRESVLFARSLMSDGFWLDLFREYTDYVPYLTRARQFMVRSLSAGFTTPLVLALRLICRKKV